MHHMPLKFSLEHGMLNIEGPVSTLQTQNHTFVRLAKGADLGENSMNHTNDLSIERAHEAFSIYDLRQFAIYANFERA